MTTGAEQDVGELLYLADRASPYAAYAEIRARGPLTYSAYGVWLAAGHATCTTVLRDHRFVSDARKHPDYQPASPNFFAPGRAVPQQHHDLLGLDPPDHTRMRRLVSQAFTPRAIERLRAFIEGTTQRLVAALVDEGDVDLIEALAFPLPLAVICHILGVPVEDRALFQQWGEDLVPLLDPFQEEEAAETGARAQRELCAYLDALITERRAAPGDDLLSHLITVEEAGDRLNADELLGTATLILGAGFETTVNLIGNGTLALLRNPDQLAVLRDEPSLLGNAVNELLRFDSPVQLTVRIAAEDVDVAGSPIKAGDMVLTLLGAANRDPAVFADPDRLDLRRANAGEHVSFSSGAHHCLGAALARLEGEVVFDTLLQGARSIELVDPEPAYRPFMTLHGLSALKVRLS